MHNGKGGGGGGVCVGGGGGERERMADRTRQNKYKCS